MQLDGIDIVDVKVVRTKLLEFADKVSFSSNSLQKSYEYYLNPKKANLLMAGYCKGRKEAKKEIVTEIREACE